ncbi:MAG: hypothetical protein Udaeo2_22970 [Candidatus Udaeobacter sp.]|nr:MAG: hypothetical protein Udaeo2_22970 [Candidatus Udaeobacter sp.]
MTRCCIETLKTNTPGHAASEGERIHAEITAFGLVSVVTVSAGSQRLDVQRSLNAPNRLFSSLALLIRPSRFPLKKQPIWSNLRQRSVPSQTGSERS